MENTASSSSSTRQPQPQYDISILIDPLQYFEDSYSSSSSEGYSPPRSEIDDHVSALQALSLQNPNSEVIAYSLRAPPPSLSSLSRYRFIGTYETVRFGMKRRVDLTLMWKFFEDPEKKLKSLNSLDERFASFNSFPITTEYRSIGFWDMRPEVQQISRMTPAIMGDDPALQLEATTQLGRLLSSGHKKLISTVIERNFLPRFMTFLIRGDTQLQFRTLCTLINMAAGSSQDTEVLIIHGVVPLLVQLLTSSADHAVRDQALWALGNIAGDSDRARDLVANHGALFQVLSLMWDPSIRKTTTWNIATWAFSIMFIGKRPVFHEQIQPALSSLQKLLHQPDEEDALFACETISVLFQWGSNDIIAALIQAEIFSALVALLKFPTSRVLVPTLQIIGYITAGDDTHTEILIRSGVLSCLKSLVTHTDEAIVTKVCWIISNIVCGKGYQAVINEDFIRLFLNLTKMESTFRKEAVLTIVNAVYHGDEESILYSA